MYYYYSNAHSSFPVLPLITKSASLLNIWHLLGAFSLRSSEWQAKTLLTELGAVLDVYYVFPQFRNNRISIFGLPVNQNVRIAES